MTDNFDMKKFLVENKLGAYSRLKEATNFSEPWKYEFVKDGDDCIKIDPETGARSKVHHSYCKRTQNETETKVEENQLNEYEVTYEYGSDGGCYRVDDDGNYDEVDDIMCKKYAGQGVREDIGGDIGDAQAEKMMDFLAEKDKVKEEVQLKQKQYYQIYDAGMDEWHDDYQYMGKVGGGSSAGEVGEHMFAAFEAPGSFTFVSISNDDLDAMVKPTKNGLNEALSPEMFERMDNFASNSAQIAMIRAAEIMMNDLTEEGFEVEDIREYFTQLIANDI